MKRSAAVLLALFALAPPAGAVDPSEMLKDPVQERRAEELGKGLRCMVCQSESIEDSNADLAKDLRIIVREHIAAGETNEQVRQYVVERYGDYVLLKPPFKAATLVLWVGPFALFFAALGTVVLFYRRRQRQAPAQPAPLSAEEKRRLDALLKAPK